MHAFTFTFKRPFVIHSHAYAHTLSLFLYFFFNQISNQKQKRRSVAICSSGSVRKEEISTTHGLTSLTMTMRNYKHTNYLIASEADFATSNIGGQLKH